MHTYKQLFSFQEVGSNKKSSVLSLLKRRRDYQKRREAMLLILDDFLNCFSILRFLENFENCTVLYFIVFQVSQIILHYTIGL